MIDRGLNSVSVIIPTWNRASSIRAAIESALSQTFEVTEILVCDDGSTDSTAEIVREISQIHKNVIWVPGPRSGRPAVPRNRGLKLAKSEWIAFLDSDDIWLPDKLDVQIRGASDSGCFAACTNTWRKKPAVTKKDLLLSTKARKITFRNLLYKNLVHCSSALVHKKILDKTGGFPESPSLTVGEDYALWLRVSTLTDIVYIPEPYVVYLDDASNSIRSKSLNAWAEKENILKNFMQWAKNNSPPPPINIGVECNFILIKCKCRKIISYFIKFLFGRR
ncbi:glycosyltransferase family 2 protein [Thalassospira xiamenensis]|uniref:glycosyltransferase family 2 protein n=1 Tax=Thalassospira xiamenensis TaxID=220697 RepID=UPI003AA96FC5